MGTENSFSDNFVILYTLALSDYVESFCIAAFSAFYLYKIAELWTTNNAVF